MDVMVVFCAGADERWEAMVGRIGASDRGGVWFHTDGRARKFIVLNDNEHYSHPFFFRIRPTRSVPAAYVMNHAYPIPMRPNRCIMA